MEQNIFKLFEQRTLDLNIKIEDVEYYTNESVAYEFESMDDCLCMANELLEIICNNGINPFKFSVNSDRVIEIFDVIE